MEYSNHEDVIKSLRVAHDPLIAKIRSDFFVKENDFFKSYIKNLRVLVAGSGLGDDAFELAAYNMEVLGVEIFEEMVALARQEAKNRGLKNISFEKGDIYNLPYDNNSFGAAVLNMGSIGNFNDRELLIKELLRVSKRAYIDFYILENLDIRKKMYEEEGWKNVSIKDYAVVLNNWLVSRSLPEQEFSRIAKNLGVEVELFPLNSFSKMAVYFSNKNLVMDFV